MPTGSVMHIWPEDLRLAANEFNRLSHDSQEVLNRVYSCWWRLDNGWEWYARANASGQFRQVKRELSIMIAVFSQMSAALLKAANEIEAADKASTLFYSPIDLSPNTDPSGSIWNDLINSNLIGNSRAAILSNFDLAGLLFQGGNLTIEMLLSMSNNRVATRELFRELGRGLNAISGSRGFVGKMDDLYRAIFVKNIPYLTNISFLDDFDKFTNSAPFELGLVGTDILFGLFGDLREGTYGEDYLRAIGVNSFDSLIQFGLTKNPAGAIVFAANSVYQITGDLGVGMRRTLADLFVTDAEMNAMLHQDADVIADAIDRADLGNITKKLSEGIYTNFTDRLSFMADSADLGVRSIKEMWRDPSWQTIKTVTEMQWAFQREHVGDYIGMALDPSGLFLPTSEEGWNSYGEAGLATVNVIDGLIDGSVVSLASDSKLIVNAIDQDSGIVDWIQQGQDWTIGLINIEGDI